MTQRDTCVHSNFSPVLQSVLNVKPAEKEETEENKVERHKTFVEKHAKEIKHFGRRTLFKSCESSRVVEHTQ